MVELIPYSTVDERFSIEINRFWFIGVFFLLVVNDSIGNALTLPYLINKQRVAPSGEIVVLQHYIMLTSFRMILASICIFVFVI